jgi:hypothetical protein
MDQEAAAAERVWEYLHMGHDLVASDVIVCMGSSDLRVATYAAELYMRGLAPLLLFSGGVGTGPHSGHNLLGWEQILLEPRSANSGENIRFASELLRAESQRFEAAGGAARSILVVHKPFMERRAFATFMKQWPVVEGAAPRPAITLASPPLTFTDYLIGTPIGREDTISIMVGDLQRIKRYTEPPHDFQIAQDIPADVWEAGQLLVAAGFTSNLIGDAL